MIDDIENFIIEEVEKERGFVHGDFMRAVEVFWYTIKFFMSQDEMPVIKIKYFGTFRPEYRVVNKAIRREIKKIRESNGARERDKLYRLLVVRRMLIDSGYAPKMYYYKKRFRNGREIDDPRAYGAYRALCSRLERLSASRNKQGSKK